MDTKGLKKLALRKIEVLVEAYEAQREAVELIVRQKEAGFYTLMDGPVGKGDARDERGAIKDNLKVLKALADGIVVDEETDEDWDYLTRVLLALNEEWANFAYRETGHNNALVIAFQTAGLNLAADRVEALQEKVGKKGSK